MKQKRESCGNIPADARDERDSILRFRYSKRQKEPEVPFAFFLYTTL